jgi:hypothetical protein
LASTEPREIGVKNNLDAQKALDRQLDAETSRLLAANDPRLAIHELWRGRRPREAAG